MSEDRISEIRARHREATELGPGSAWAGICVQCDDVMPCDAVILLAERDALRAAITDALYDYDRGDELGCVERLRAAVVAPSAEGERYV